MQSHAASLGAVSSSGATVAPHPAAVQNHAAVAATPASGTYTRTVLVETFTAEWCEFCEDESQALFAIEHQSSPPNIVIAELHICGSPTDYSNCYDNYPTLDGTGVARMNFYNVQAFPTVFFDGGHVQVGAANTVPELEQIYENNINASLAVPGNVSISQAAIVSTATSVSSQATITSGVTGTFHAMTYLVEYIGKNDSTHHDIDWVVRGTVASQTLSLTAGETTTLMGSMALTSGWDAQHLYVITFVQDNSTKIVQNSNMVPVSTIQTSVSADPSTIPTGYSTNVTVSVTNSSTTAPVSGATVMLSTNAGGTFASPSGVTGTDGTFTSMYTAPHVTDLTDELVTAEVSAAGYTSSAATTTIVVNPLAPPTSPLSLSLAPQADGTVLLSWSPPASGGGGVTYHLYRSTSATSGFAEISSGPDTTYTDSALASDQSYWYKVDAANAAGFSGNSTAMAIGSVVATAQGLPSSMGWWLTVDSLALVSPTNAPISLHLAPGVYSYTFGPGSYAYLASAASGSVSVMAGNPASITASFEPRYAILQGTVSPANATVTLNGSPLSVSSGAFSKLLVAGTYSIVVSSPGYHTNSSMVTVTPGNETTLPFVLNPLSSSTGSTQTTSGSNQGLSTLEAGAVIGAAAIIGVVVILAAVMSTRRKRGRQPPRPSRPMNRYASNDDGEDE
ncbi:MAG TPA: PEGA domain-containing protein [Thermoplasmata archaeon]|nr:PEGA domain-containing protein [Thermoplasmata archaeon]